MISLILSGGVGSRLWPVSREKLPKQFSHLFKETLFSQTVQRLQTLGDVYVCTSETLRGQTENSIRKQKLKVTESFYEPFGRNTAPAIGLVCQVLLRQGLGEKVMGVFPSDHWIEKQEVFNQALQLAEECALQGKIVTIGLNPTYAATGFGYIDCSQDAFAQAGKLKAFPVRSFKEKPNKETAEEYLRKGHYYWNSGMFVFQIQTMVEAFKQFLPDTWKKLEGLKDDLSNITEVYESISPESIDFGIMEKFKSQVNIPCDIGWSDLGSWDDVAQATESGELEQEHPLFTENSSGCFTFSDTGKTIALSEVDNLIVVDTADALLITRKGQSQSVKKIVEMLKSQDSDLLKDHVFEYRPWGMYKNLHEEKEFKSKVIVVEAGQQLSYQSHKHRSEIWVITVGSGEVVINDETIPVSKGSVVEISQGSKHRMRNTGPSVLKFIEVQLGDYFGEDDIIRYADDYKRV